MMAAATLRIDRRRTARAVAWGLAGTSLALAGASLVLVILDRSTLQPYDAQPMAISVVQDVAAPVALVLSVSILGALITSRQPGNRIGRLFLGASLAVALALFAQEFAIRGLWVAPGSLPAARVMAWLQVWLWDLTVPLALVLLLLLFPDGHLPGRTWLPVLWAGLAAAGLQVLASLNNPFPVGPAIRTAHTLPVSMPPALWGVGRFVDRAAHGEVTWGASAVLATAGVAVLLRLRRAAGEERQQLKWLTYAGSITVVGILLTRIPDLPFLARSPHPLLNRTAEYSSLLWSLAAAVGIPVAAGIAIFRHRLFDIDVVINKTMVFGALAAFVTVVYVVIVVGMGRALRFGGDPSPGLSILATAIVAVAFQPVRTSSQRLANRLVYGKRATPYEVLAHFADRMAGTYSTEEVLPRMARILAEGTGSARVNVWVRMGSELRPVAAWPVEEPPPAPLALSGRDVPDVVPGADRTYLVRHQGDLLGAFSVTKARGERLTQAEDKLLADLAAEAGLVLRNVRLVGEVKASRQRIVAAQDEERRRVERDLHDGAQQRLVNLSLALSMAQGRLGPDDDPELRGTLTGAADELSLALDELRELARGIHPAILTEEGLAAALESLADRSPVPAMVVEAPRDRLPTSVEVTAYFVVSEALANVAKYAKASDVTIRVARFDRHIVVEVVDDGVGGADVEKGSGLRGLEDRVAALDGRITVDSPLGGGTRIVAKIPYA
jgi:signal transduction histidine kinase